MKLDFAAFAFIFTLAAVINGLGIVRWLTGFSEYLKRREDLDVSHFWVFNVVAAFQFLLHILLWWSLWGIRSVETFNFLHYLYLLTGPILLFLASSLLIPDFVDASADIRKHYFRIKNVYATVLGGFWIWAMLLWPALKGIYVDSIPIMGTFLLLAVVQRSSMIAKAQGAVAVLNWVLLAAFILFFQLQLGGIFAGQK
jgi:hypothetical protein